MFSIKESIKYGWEKVIGNFWKIVSLALISYIPSLVSSFISNSMEGSGSLPSFIPVFLISVGLSILGVILTIGLMKIFLRMYDGEDPKIEEIFSYYKLFWNYISVSILYGLIVLGGLILLIVPGIIWAIKYSFAPLIVVDTGVGPRAALRESANLTKNLKSRLLGFGIVCVVVALLGYLVFMVGALVSVPVVSFAWIYVYRKLSREKAGISTNPVPAPVAQ